MTGMFPNKVADNRVADKFAIQYFVGPRSPTGWITGTERFPTHEETTFQIYDRTRKEKRADITPIMRRAVTI